VVVDDVTITGVDDVDEGFAVEVVAGLEVDDG